MLFSDNKYVAEKFSFIVGIFLRLFAAKILIYFVLAKSTLL